MNIFKNTMDILNRDKERDTKTTVRILGKLLGEKTEIISALIEEGERTVSDFKSRTEWAIDKQRITERQYNLLANSQISVEAFLSALDRSNKSLKGE